MSNLARSSFSYRPFVFAFKLVRIFLISPALRDMTSSSTLLAVPVDLGTSDVTAFRTFSLTMPCLLGSITEERILLCSVLTAKASIFPQRIAMMAVASITAGGFNILTSTENFSEQRWRTASKLLHHRVWKAIGTKKDMNYLYQY